MSKLTKWKWRLVIIVFLGGLIALIERYRSYRESSQDAPILDAAWKYGVDPALIKAVVWRESWFNPHVKGRKGEIGLMQIRGAAADEWSKSEHVLLFTHQQLFDPGKNTLAGAWYLRKLLGRYQAADDAVPYALADYNAGRAHVLQWAKGEAVTNSVAFIEQIGFPATKDYVQAVMKRRKHYRRAFPQGP